MEKENMLLWNSFSLVTCKEYFCLYIKAKKVFSYCLLNFHRKKKYRHLLCIINIFFYELFYFFILAILLFHFSIVVYIVNNFRRAFSNLILKIKLLYLTVPKITKEFLTDKMHRGKEL